MPKDIPDFETVALAVDEVKKGFEQFKEAAELRDKELLTKGSVDTLLEEKLTKINEDLSEKQVIIDKLYATTRRQSITLDGKEVSREELDAKALDFARIAGARRDRRIDTYTHEEMVAYKSAFHNYLRIDDAVLSADEQKALSVGSDPDGGYVVDPDTSGRVTKKVYETSPMRQYASIQVISTSSLEGLFDLDEAAAGWVGETDSRPETGTPKLQKWSIPTHELYAEPRATQKLLDDASIDMESWLSGKVADKFARVEAAAFVNGSGVDKPRGFLTYPDGTANPGQIQRIGTGVNGAFAAAPAGGDAFISMVYGLKAPYRNNATFAMNRGTQGAVRLLKDTDGHYIWQPSIVAGQPSTLAGYGVASFEDMPAHTVTDSLAVAFADFGEMYQIVERIGIRVLRDPYTAKPYIKFYTTKRVGGDVINFEAGILLEFTA